MGERCRISERVQNVKKHNGYCTVHVPGYHLNLNKFCLGGNLFVLLPLYMYVLHVHVLEPVCLYVVAHTEGDPGGHG